MRLVVMAAAAALLACATTTTATADPAPRKAPLSRRPPRTPKSVKPTDDSPAWLGIGLEQGKRGVKVTEVIEGTPAAEVGLRIGDEIVAIDGVPLAGPDDLVGRVHAHRSGDRITLEVARGARKVAVAAVLAPKLDDQEILERRLLDKQAPAFDLPVVGSDAAHPTTLALDGLRGKVVVLEFLATWCYPCKSTYKQLSDLQDQRGGDGLVVLGLSEETDSALAGLISQEGIRFRVVRDVGGAVARNYRRPGTPTFVVIDRDGVVRFVGAGAGLSADHAVFSAERLLDAPAR
jgi:peroxiredoxin